MVWWLVLAAAVSPALGEVRVAVTNQTAAVLVREGDTVTLTCDINTRSQPQPATNIWVAQKYLLQVVLLPVGHTGQRGGGVRPAVPPGRDRLPPAVQQNQADRAGAQLRGAVRGNSGNH